MMLTCQQLAELVTDYSEGRLTLRQRLAFQFHLGLCRDCRAYLAQVRTTVETLGRLPQEEMPPHVQDELMERFKTWKHNR